MATPPAWVKQIEVTGGTARQPAPVSLLTSGEKGVAHDDWVVIIQGGQFGSQGVPAFISSPNSGWHGNQATGVASRSLGVWAKKVDDVEEFSQPLAVGDPRSSYTGRQLATVLVLDGKTVKSFNFSDGVTINTTNSNQIKTAVAKANKPHLLVSLQHYTSGDHARPFEGAIQTIDDGQKTVQPAPNSSSSILVGWADKDYAFTDASIQTCVAVWPFTAEGLDPTPPTAEKHENWYILGADDTIRDQYAALTVIGDDGQEKGTMSMAAMPRGLATWQELIDRDRSAQNGGENTDGFFVAHRGGSRSWVEHTENAYTQSVSFGVDALEFSCNESKDGVWFGLHDKTFESLGGLATDPHTMTWEEIKAAVPTDKLPARLDWLLDRYGQTHCLVIDPKYRAGEWKRLLKYITDRNVSPAQIVIKYYGDSNWLFEQAKAEGCGAWGYAYSADTSKPWYETFKSSTGPLDFLSMQWDAPANVVNDLRASNKPVVAHVLDDQTQYVRAAQKGMRSAIVAGVKGVLQRQC